MTPVRGWTSSLPVLAVVAWCAALGSGARADGALPNSFGVLLPKDRPRSILVATNFGLVSSEDDGAHWSLVCEEAVGIGAALYQIGPPPQDRLFTVTLDGIARSTDLGCNWEEVLALHQPTDVFPDPNDAHRIYAIAHQASKDGSAASPQAVFASKDGGETFGSALFAAPSNADLTGFEAAAGDAKILYTSLTLLEGEASHPYMARSNDGGKTWTMSSIEKTAGMQLPRILAVDADDSKRVYLRLSGTASDQLGIYDSDTGMVDIALDLQASMSAFLRRADGRLLVAADDGRVFVSKKPGASFAQLAGTTHLRGLGERGGKLYAATDVSQDDFAVAESDDDGATWRPLLRFAEIDGLRQCGTIASTCAMAWSALQFGLAMPAGPRPFYDSGVREPRPIAGPLNTQSGGGGCSVTRRSASSAADTGWLGATAIVCSLLCVRRARRCALIDPHRGS